jgi:hypothetical protein
MDAAAPEAAEPQEKAEPQSETRKRPWSRVKIPTSVVVTLVGIALTAWLLPAFTHQWDDRQKARELKATVLTDMSVATSRALVGGEAIWSTPARTVNRAKLADEWARSSLSIEARLRAYMPQRIVTAWQIYVWMIDRFIAGSRGQAVAGLRSASEAILDGRDTHDVDLYKPEPRRLNPGAAFAAAGVVATTFQGPGPSFRLPSDTDAVGYKLDYYIPDGPRGRQPASSFAPEWQPDFGQVELALLRFQQELTREILSAHASGFSTSTRDLVNDLLP